MWSLEAVTTLVLAGVSLPTGTAAAQAPLADSAATRAITPGGTVTGTLGKDDALSADSTFVQSWTMSGQAGQTITIELISTDFDAYVMSELKRWEKIIRDNKVKID